MKLKLDENLPRYLRATLRRLENDVSTAGWRRHRGFDVCGFAKRLVLNREEIADMLENRMSAPPARWVNPSETNLIAER